MGALQAVKENDLKDSFQKFNRLSKSLEFSYLHLEQHLSQLHEQLEAAKTQNLVQTNKNQLLADRLHAILNALPAGVIVLDSNGNVQDCNPAALKILGEPLLDERWSCVVARTFELLQEKNNDVLLKDGRILSMATVPLGNYPGQVIMLNDLTETRKLEEKLNQHKRLKSMGEMAASLAHQIRTPISTSILHSSQLKNPSISDGKRFNLIDKIISQMGDLEKIVSNMLIFSKNNTQEFEKCKLINIVDDVIDSLQASICEKKINIEVVVQSIHITVLVNKTTIQSAIQNIIINAIQAVSVKGNIKLNLCAKSASSVELSVTDNGVGISVDRFDDIFEPFVTDKKSGTGLGLSVVQAIARAHNGDIYVKNSQVGKGSTFALWLPMMV